MEKSVRKIVSLLTGSDDEVERLLAQRAPLTAHGCYQTAVSHFRTHCFNWHTPTVSGTPKRRHCCPGALSVRRLQQGREEEGCQAR